MSHDLDITQQDLIYLLSLFEETWLRDTQHEDVSTLRWLMEASLHSYPFEDGISEIISEILQVCNTIPIDEGKVNILIADGITRGNEL